MLLPQQMTRNASSVGKSFTLKRVQEEWKKICIEFDKRENSSLPFYYFSSSHDRFYEDERPDFNTIPAKPRQPMRAPRREIQSVSNSFEVLLSRETAGVTFIDNDSM